MKYKLFDSEEEMLQLLQNRIPRLVSAGNQEVCIVNVDGTVLAFNNLCPHMGASLHQGWLNGQKEIICPLHAYKFDLSTGQEENRRCKDLHFVHIETNPDGVFLSLGEAEEANNSD